MGWDMNGGRQDGHTEMFFLNQNTFFQLTVLTGVTIILIDFVHIVYQDLICHLVVNPLLPWTISAYFFDDEISERVVLATNTYAEDKKDRKPSMYRRFKQKKLTTLGSCSFWGSTRSEITDKLGISRAVK